MDFKIGFEERFYWSQRVKSVNHCTSCLFGSTVDLFGDNASKNDGLRTFAITTERAIAWPEVHSNQRNTLSIRSVALENIPVVMKLQSLHNICVNGNIFLFVCAHFEGNFDDFYLFTYRFVPSNRLGVNSSLESTQDHFHIGYCPVSLARASLNNSTYIVVSGSDYQLHTYEIDICSGKLYRNIHLHTISTTNTANITNTTIASSQLRSNSIDNREDVRSHWNSRLQFDSACSLGMCLAIEEWLGGSQGVVGHANGLLFADAFPAPRDIISERRDSCDDSMNNSNTTKGFKRDSLIGLLQLDDENDGDCLPPSPSMSTRAPVSPVPRKPNRFYVDVTEQGNNNNNNSNNSNNGLSANVPAVTNGSGNNNSSSNNGSVSNVSTPTKYSQGIAAVGANGNITHHRKDSPWTFYPTNTSTASAAAAAATASPALVPRSRQCALLLEGAISSLVLFNTRRKSFLPSYCPMDKLSSIGDPLDFACSNAVIVGTTAGIAAVLLLSSHNIQENTINSPIAPEHNLNNDTTDVLSDSAKTTTTSTSTSTSAAANAAASTTNILLPGSGKHGVVHAIATGNVSLNGYLDILIGFEDGTVIIAGRDLNNSNSSNSNGKKYHLPIHYSLLWQQKFAHSIQNICFGAFTRNGIEIITNSSPINSQNGTTLRLWADQLVIQTAEALHIFVSKDWTESEMQCNSNNNNSNSNIDKDSNIDAITSASISTIQTTATTVVTTTTTTTTTTTIPTEEADAIDPITDTTTAITTNSSNTTVITRQDDNNNNNMEKYRQRMSIHKKLAIIQKLLVTANAYK